MEAMLRDRGLAEELGRKARETAIARFSLERFLDDWNHLLAGVTGRPAPLLSR